jgi:hypothetical protein
VLAASPLGGVFPGLAVAAPYTHEGLWDRWRRELGEAMEAGDVARAEKCIRTILRHPGLSSVERFELLQAKDAHGRSALERACRNGHFGALRSFTLLVSSSLGLTFVPQHRRDLLLARYPTDAAAGGKPLLFRIGESGMPGNRQGLTIHALLVPVAETTALTLRQKLLIVAAAGRSRVVSEAGPVQTTAAASAVDARNPAAAAAMAAAICRGSPDDECDELLEGLGVSLTVVIRAHAYLERKGKRDAVLRDGAEYTLEWNGHAELCWFDDEGALAVTEGAVEEGDVAALKQDFETVRRLAAATATH